MNEKNINSNVADALLQSEIVISFDIRPVNFLHELLQRFKLSPIKLKYVMRPVTLGTLIKISKLLIDIDMSIFDIKNLLESNYQAIVKHGRSYATIVAIAIHGKPGQVPESLVNNIVNNFTTKELEATMNIVFRQMDIKNFMSSIISMKGNLQVVEMSQKMPEELIASGALSVAL